MTKVKTNCWSKGRQNVKTYYYSNTQEYINVNGKRPKAEYNLNTKVLSIRYIGLSPTLIDEIETRKLMIKNLKQYLQPTSGVICVVEQSHKVQNEDKYYYTVEYYTTLANIPTDEEMKDVTEILNNVVENDDEVLELERYRKREMNKKYLGKEYDEDYTTQKEISNNFKNRYADAITLTEYEYLLYKGVL